MDGFDSLGKTKLIMATNRPDTLDPALLRPGRLDRKIEIPLPNEQGRLEILKIHAKGINKSGDIDYEAVVKLSDGFNGADLRNVCTEAGMFAIREDRYVSFGRLKSRVVEDHQYPLATCYRLSGCSLSLRTSLQSWIHSCFFYSLLLTRLGLGSRTCSNPS